MEEGLTLGRRVGDKTLYSLQIDGQLVVDSGEWR